MRTNKFGFYATSVILFASTLCSIVHLSLLKQNVLPGAFKGTPFWSLYFFLIPASLFTVWFVLWRYKKDHTSAGRAYFITVFFKMFGSAFFLYPGLVVKSTFLRETAIQFMALFFVFLFIETFLLIKLLNKPLDENSKNDENQ